MTINVKCKQDFKRNKTYKKLTVQDKDVTESVTMKVDKSKITSSTNAAYFLPSYEEQRRKSLESYLIFSINDDHRL